MDKPLTPKSNESQGSSPQINLLMKEEKWIPVFSKEEIIAIQKHLDKQRESEIHPDSAYGQWMKRNER